MRKLIDIDFGGIASRTAPKEQKEKTMVLPCCGSSSARADYSAESHTSSQAFVMDPWTVNAGVFGPNKAGKTTFLKQLMYTASSFSSRLANTLIFHAKKHWINEIAERLNKVTQKKKLKRFQKEAKAIVDLNRRLSSSQIEPYDKPSKQIAQYNTSLFKLMDGMAKELFRSEEEYLQCRSSFSLDPRVPALNLALSFKHRIHPTNFSPVKYKTEQYKYKFFHSYYKDLNDQMEVADIGKDLDMIVLIFSAADVIVPDKFEKAVESHRWIFEIALKEYGPSTVIVLSNIDVLDDYCTKNDLSISKELEKATDHLAETFSEINDQNPKPPHIQAMDLTSSKFFFRILKTINSAFAAEVAGMPLKGYKEQRKRNYLKSVYGIGGRRGSQTIPSDANTFSHQ